MQKFLRMLTLTALLLVPWVTQAQTPLFSEDFEGGSMPTGWTTDGPGSWSVGTGDYSSGTGAGQGTYNAKISHSSTGNVTKLITPAIDFTGVSSAVLSYMHIERSWAGDIDELRVYYRNDTTGTWTLLSGQEFTAAVSAWTTESDIILPNLSNTYQIAFEFTDRYGYGLGIDNVVIEQGSSCTRPTGLAANLTPGNGTVATLNWTAGGTESAWVLEYGTASDFSNATSVNVTATPTAGPSYSLTGLTAESTYYARVKAVCSATEQSGWCNTICTFTPTNAYYITVNDGTATNGYVPIFGYWCDNSIKSTFIIPATDLAAMQYGTITKLTFYASDASVSWGNAQFTVYMSETTDNTVSGIADFTTMTQVMTAASLGINDNIMEVTLTTPYQYMGGNLMIAFDQPTSGSYSSCNWYGVSANGASYGGYGSSVDQQNFLPKTRFDYTPGQAPTCPTPTQLAVNYTGGNSAQVSWDSTATLWNIKVNGVVTNNVTANPYTLTGLNFGATYTIQVQTNCDGDTSQWTSPVTFTTDLCDTNNMCAITITVTDAYSDGGGQIQVVDSVTNEVLGTYTNSGSSTTYTLNVCNGRTLNFVFASTDSWSYENGWVITDINEEVVSSHEGCANSGNCDAPTNGVVGTYTVDCTVSSCRRPTALAASEVGSRSVQLGWTENGEATSWVVAYAPAGDIIFTEVAAATNPYTLTGLTPETAYTVKVRPVCSDQFIRWSDPISFTTDVACPAPTSLAVTTGTTVADVNWNGNANNYTLQYTQVPTGTVPTGDSIVLSYDNGSYASGIGNSSPQDWSWGVMYPASMYMGGNLTKVSVFETSNYSDTTYTVKIYSGGTTAPDSLLASQVVTPMGSDGFHEITLTSPVTIDFAQNLWIVLEAYGSYVMSSCNSTNPNNNWVYNGGVWMHLGDAAASLAGNGWMIRAQINPFNLDALTWTTVNNATAPASLTGLTAETDYITRVKAVCG
ncbi:MAG: fibronectin type III domain-containing protein, partial [Bacteroidales bacterium]|nr:fibronectin type III domain-containing protein [Bacteroidales bacterium]